MKGSEILQGYPLSVSGHRIMIGFLLDWPEVYPRCNRAHFFEVDLFYSELYNFNETIDPTYCNDIVYDRCFFDQNGVYAEGRFVNSEAVFGMPPLPLNSDSMTHVIIPVSAFARNLSWVQPPVQGWETATIKGAYIGIESMGITRLWIQATNYQLYKRI